MKKTARKGHCMFKEYIYDPIAKAFRIIFHYTPVYSKHDASRNVIPVYPSPFGHITDEHSFFAQIHNFVEYFKNFIELNTGYKLLWDDTKTIPRSEEHVQILFKGILDQHCIANNIDFTREVNQGMGPVDFRFSCGYRNRVLLEIKLAQNTRFWNGLKKQLPQYMKVDSCQYGIFLVVVYTDNDMDRIKDIERIRAETECEHGVQLKVVIVDARPDTKKSASK